MAKARRSRTKAKSKARPPRAAGATRPQPKGAGSEVERRWNEYWRCRKDLEDAVDKVRTARETLNKAMDLERGKRSDFEQIKRSLTELLDVEPAGAPRLVATSGDPKQSVS